MKNKFLLIALAGGGALYFSSKKKKTTPKEEKLPSLDDLNYDDLPQVEDEPMTDDQIQEEQEDMPLPLPEEEGKGKVEDLKIDENVLVNFDFGKFYSLHKQTGKEYPEKGDTQDLWISDSCNSWGIGKDFEGRLPQKLVLWDTEEPEAMISPTEYWDIGGGDISPEPWYPNILPNGPIAAQWAANLIDYHKGNCNVIIPRRGDYESYQDYAVIISKFVKTPIGNLWAELYKRIEDHMYADWAAKNPKKAFDHELRINAVDAVRKNPNKSINEQTNIAYYNSFDNEPKKLDPNNPEHKPFIDAWNKIKMYVKEYIGYAKQYGY